jgi:hypothetical protein
MSMHGMRQLITLPDKCYSLALHELYGLVLCSNIELKQLPEVFKNE